jgi:hypothetical protein
MLAIWDEWGWVVVLELVFLTSVATFNMIDFFLILYKPFSQWLWRFYRFLFANALKVTIFSSKSGGCTCVTISLHF